MEASAVAPSWPNMADYVVHSYKGNVIYKASIGIAAPRACPVKIVSVLYITFTDMGPLKYNFLNARYTVYVQCDHTAILGLTRLMYVG